MKNLYRLPIRLYGLLLLMGAMALALSTTATGRTPLADPLALIAPTYNCDTGAITFNTTGGDGSTITYQAPGIVRSSLTSNTGTVEQGLRNDPKPITIQATQSGKTTSYLFNFGVLCKGLEIRLFGVDTTVVVNKAIQLVIGAGAYDQSNPISRWSKTITGLPPGTFFDYQVRGLSAYAFYIIGTPTTAGTYPIVLTVIDPRYPNLPITSSFTITVTNTTTNPDRAILVDLYNSTNGAGWTKKTNWLQGDSPCNWFGVTCNGTGRVTKLTLVFNSMGGVLPASLGNLSQLAELDLSLNYIQGALPASLGNLSQLTRMNFSGNRLIGEIPTTLGNLSQLTVLDLAVNDLGGLGGLTGPIPASLGNLSQLTSLYLRSNNLSGSIPSELGNLSRLVYIDLGANKLSGSIPASFGNLSQLSALYLSGNLLSGSIPASLGNLSLLTSLQARNNNLSGCFPTELASLCGKDVSFSENPGLPGGGNFGNFCSNRTGACTTTPTTGALALIAPTYDCGTGGITFKTTGGDGSTISYQAPGITGPTTNPNQFVDAELRQAADAQPLTLSATQSGVTVTYKFDLRTTCPIGTNPPVQTNPDRAALVDLYNSTNGLNWTNKTNWLQGDSPCNWYGISCDETGRVVKINIGYNNLTGTLPASLGNLSQLQSLIFFQNPLIGTLPASLGNLSQLTSLNIEYTQIAGEIPASLGNLTKLKQLFLAQNQLIGYIPASLGSLPQLEYLYLFGNNLTKCIPAELASLCGKDVRIASGAMPDSFFTTFCSNGTGTCSTTPITGSLALTAPTYNCTTGAIKFNTAEGNGTLIEYQAPGITGWTSNPNQFVDQQSRTANDVQPFVLMARQSGNVVTYTWDLKQACGRARVATEEAGTTLSLQLLGNPVHETVQVLIKGAEGQPVQLQLTDVRGRLLESRAIEQAGAEEVQQFKLDPSTGPGMLFLQATKEQQTRTVKIIRQ